MVQKGTNFSVLTLQEAKLGFVEQGMVDLLEVVVGELARVLALEILFLEVLADLLLVGEELRAGVLRENLSPLVC